MFGRIKNLLSRATIESPSVPLTAENIIDYVSPESDTASGIRISPQIALQNPAVWRGVNLIAQSVAKLPLLVYRRAEDDGREKATSHPAYKLLKYSPSPLYTVYKFKETLQSQAVLHGNAYAYILRDEFGKPTELMILDPEGTQLKTEAGRYYYSTQLGEKQFNLAMSDVLHIKGLSPDGLLGFCATHLMRDALGEGLSYIKYGASYFKNGAKPSVVIELPPNVRDAEKIEEFRKLWGQQHGGLSNSHRPAFLRNGSSITPLGGNNETAQLLQLRQHDLILVADFLGLPPHKLGAAIATSYSSLESENKAFLSDSLDGWLNNWEQECMSKLLSERAKTHDTHFIEFERKALLATDTKTESDLLIAEVNNGLLSWEEARKIRNRPADKDEAQEWRRPANIILEGEESLDDGAGIAIPPPLEAPLEPSEEKEVAEDPEKENATERRLRMLTEDTIDRLTTRLLRSIEAKKYNFVEDHLDVYVDALKAYPEAEDISRSFLEDIEEEVKAALPEQITMTVTQSKKRILGALWKSEDLQNPTQQ